MIRELETNAPRHLSFIKDRLQTVEIKLKKFGWVPLLSAVTGGAEALVGTVGTIYAFASAFFYKARLYIPRPFVSKETNRIWAHSKSIDQSLQVLVDSVKMVAMGVLKAIPVIGNLSAVTIDSLVAQNRVVERARTESQARVHELEEQLNVRTVELDAANKKLAPLLEESQNKDAEVSRMKGELDACREKISTVEAPLRLEIDAKVKELELKKNELAQLQSSVGDNQKKVEELQAEVNRSTGLLEQAKNKLGEIEGRSNKEIAALQESLRDIQEAAAAAQFALKAEQDRVVQLRDENGALKQQLEDHKETKSAADAAQTNAKGAVAGVTNRRKRTGPRS